jgi:tRNA A37 methylthiotransferase MiaB
MDWTESFIQLMAQSPRIAKHAHVPMQSGSDSVLRRMHRKYRPWHYREKIEKIRAAMPTAAIGADVMVGFPGETDAEFEATRQMIEELPFTYLHVFTFSARPGTPAAIMPDQVPVHVARERNRILRELAAKKKAEFMRSFVDREVEAITLDRESSRIAGSSENREAVSLASLGRARLSVVSKADIEVSDGTAEGRVLPSSLLFFTSALTDNYLKLKLHGIHSSNRWLQARIEAVEQDRLVGRVA